MNTPHTAPDILHEQARLLRAMTTSLSAGDPIAYRRAQERFAHLTWLRELKAYDPDSIPERYIWRTRGDDKVSPEHAANNDKIFKRDNPPPTGHPGWRPNCRCTAEPMPDEDKPEFAKQTLISSVKDGPKWSDFDLLEHYYSQSGKSLRLSEIGYLRDVIHHYGERLGTFARINQQIFDAAKNTELGRFSYDFNNTYDFWTLFSGGKFSLNVSTVSGVFIGTSKVDSKYLEIDGTITYYFDDEFTDVLDFADWAEILYGVDRDRAESMVDRIDDFLAVPFRIYDQWQTQYKARTIAN